MNNDVTMGANLFSGGNVDRPREPLSMNNAVTMRPDRGASLGRIDQYELIRELGGGGFGCVYLARDTVAGIEVAVKGLPPLVRLNKEELENVRKNFALVSRLHHPNIAAALTLHPVAQALYDDKADAEKLRVFGGDTLVVMQYAPGVTLSQWRKQFLDGKVPLDKALEITRQIASALDYAHEEKILHRDIKPANVMIETGGDGKITARVLDFGLAAEIRSSMSRVSQSITDTSGTRPYMAPEQWGGRKQGKETDLYSLAVLFYELVSGEVPFASVFDTGDPVLMMNVVGREEPEISSDLSKPMRLALSKALAKKREDRFGSCIAFVDALQGRRIPGARASSRAFMFTAVTALCLVVGGVWYWHGAKEKEEVRIALDQKSREEREAAEEARRIAEEKIQTEKAEAERKQKEEAARIAAEKKKAEENERVRKTEEARLAAEKTVEAARKQKAEAERVAAEKKKSDEEERARKAEEARLAAEKKADLERKQKEEEARRVAEKEKAEATEIRVEALVLRGRIERVLDADGFKIKKDRLSDVFIHADALFDDKVMRWSESAQGFTNYIIECKSLIALDAERNSAKLKRDEAEKLKIQAFKVESEKYAPIRWTETVKLMESADKQFLRMEFASARDKYDSAAKLFAQCVDDAKSERERQQRIAEKRQSKGNDEGVDPLPRRKLKPAAQKLVGIWSCQCKVTYHDSLGSRADNLIKECLPVSSVILLIFSEDGTVSISDMSGRTFGQSNGTWKYRHGMVIMDLKSDDGRDYRLSGIINWRGNSFELHYDNAEYANMIRMICERRLVNLNAVNSSYIDGQLEVSISTKMPSFKMGNARCTPHVFTRK